MISNHVLSRKGWVFGESRQDIYNIVKDMKYNVLSSLVTSELDIWMSSYFHPCMG